MVERRAYRERDREQREGGGGREEMEEEAVN